MGGSARAGVHSDGCMVETYDQMLGTAEVRLKDGRRFEAWGAN
jgi:hypothetical protein